MVLGRRLHQTAVAQEVPNLACVVAVADTGPVFSSRDFPGGGVLIGAQKGWFLAREVSGKVTVEPVSDADTSTVFQLHDFPGGGVQYLRGSLGVARG